jgi:WD40 repeat protein
MYPGSSPHRVEALSFDTAGSSVLTLTSAGTVEKFDDRLRGTGTTRVGSGRAEGRFSPDRTLVAIADQDGTPVVRELASGRQFHLTGASIVPTAPWVLAWSSDSRALLAVRNSNDQNVAVWRLDKPDEPTLIRSETWSRAVAFGAGDNVVLPTIDGCLTVRNFVSSRVLLHACGKGQTIAIALSQDGRRLAAATSFGTVTVWDTTTWRAAVELSIWRDDTSGQGTFNGMGSDYQVSALEFGPDGTRLAICTTDQKISLWDIPSGQRWATLSGHTGDVTHLAWRPDGRALVSANTDNTLRLWTVDVDEAVRDVRTRVRSQ